MADPGVKVGPPDARWLPAALGLCTFAAYVLAVPPGPYWLDSQELGAAGVRLGVAHPTGFPLFCLAARVFAYLPVGELAFRVHLLSAACAAVCVAQVARLAGSLGRGDGPALAGGTAAGLALAASATFFRSATVTEVYAPTALFIAVALRLAIRVARGGAGERTAGLCLALLAGLGFGVHASFRLLLGPPLVLLFLWRLRRGTRWPLVAPTLAALGAAGALVYLPLRSASGHIDALDWGHPSRNHALVRHLNADRIRDAYSQEMLSTSPAVVLDHARAMGDLVEGDLGVLALVAAAGGALVLLVRRGARVPALLLLAVAVGDFVYSIWINPMGIRERQDGVPLAVALAVFAGVGVAAAGRLLGRAAPYAAGAMGVMLVVQPLLGGAGAKRAPARSDAPRAWSEAALAQCPPASVALARSDSTAAGLLWLNAVEGARPDVAVLVRQHLWDLRRDGAVLAAAGLSAEGSLWPALLAHPVRWELGEDGPPPGTRLIADVPLGWLVGEAAFPPALDVARSRRALARIFAGAAVDDENARRLAQRAYVNLGVAAARAGEPATAAALAERAVALEPRDPLAHLNLARYRLALGEDDAARRQAEDALALAPERAAAWAVLGILDARAGRCEEARRLLDRALAIDPTEPDARANRAKLDAACRPR